MPAAAGHATFEAVHTVVGSAKVNPAMRAPTTAAARTAGLSACSVAWAEVTSALSHFPAWTGSRGRELGVNDGVSIDLDRRDGVVVLAVRGEVDMANATDVSTQLLSASGDGSSIVLDLGELTYIDSAGIRRLFDLSEQLGRDQRQLGARRRARRTRAFGALVDITKLDTLVAVASSLTAAVEAATP